jgi:hypothetical protein
MVLACMGLRSGAGALAASASAEASWGSLGAGRRENCRRLQRAAVDWDPLRWEALQEQGAAVAAGLAAPAAQTGGAVLARGIHHK